MKKTNFLNLILCGLFLLFVLISYFLEYDQGQQSGREFFNIIVEMLKLLPPAFMLIGLFEVWISRETVIAHLGEKSGVKAYIFALLLAGITIGGLYVAFPIAQSLHKKGASLNVIFAYLGFAGVFRIPMNVFEISCLGLPFTLVRLMVTIPLFLFIGVVMGNILKKKNYSLKKM
jgi:uncharacterized membrane protein YraQ (UPF0718 family)